jgi:hypothetical protein
VIRKRRKNVKTQKTQMTLLRVIPTVTNDFVIVSDISSGSIYEQSRKLWVHLKDIHEFGKVPSLTTRLHKNDVDI